MMSGLERQEKLRHATERIAARASGLATGSNDTPEALASMAADIGEVASLCGLADMSTDARIRQLANEIQSTASAVANNYSNTPLPLVASRLVSDFSILADLYIDHEVPPEMREAEVTAAADAELERASEALLRETQLNESMERLTDNDNPG